MLPGPSFRSTFVFSINSLILSGFPLSSFHLSEASISAYWWLYTLAWAVLQKYRAKCLLLIVICIFSTHFAIKLFHLHYFKRWRNYGATTAACIWTNEIRTKTKLSYVTIKLAMHPIVRLGPQTMQWYH